MKRARPMRHRAAPLLVLTRIWPTRERPSLGAFVRDRVRGLPDVRVVAPRSQRLPVPLLYLLLLVDAVRAGPVRGVEAHMAVPTGLVGLLVARLRGVPLVVYSHGRDVRGWRRFPGPIRWATRFVLRRADEVVTNSQDTARFIREMGADPVVAPPGVDLGRFAVWPRPAAIASTATRPNGSAIEGMSTTSCSARRRGTSSGCTSRIPGPTSVSARRDATSTPFRRVLPPR
jgi:glycosyltransferase involved in cell wall biosynthesis